jgi:hypothetical protein
MVTGCPIQLRFQALLEEEESLFFVLIEKNSRESKGLFRAET